MTIGIGLLYPLLVASLYLQLRQLNTSSTAAVKQELKQSLTQLENQLGLVIQNVDDLKKEVAVPNERAAAPDAKIGELKAAIEATNIKIDTLGKTVDDVHSETMSASKTIAGLARQSVSGSKLSDFLGQVDSDPQLKLEFADAVQNVLPQRKWGKLFVNNRRATSVDLIIDNPDRPRLVERFDPLKHVFASFPVGTEVWSPENRAQKWMIEEADLHLEINPAGLVYRSSK
jgi:hypothetical protein